jgi:hypothetical protein
MRLCALQKQPQMRRSLLQIQRAKQRPSRQKQRPSLQMHRAKQRPSRQMQRAMQRPSRQMPHFGRSSAAAVLISVVTISVEWTAVLGGEEEEGVDSG